MGRKLVIGVVLAGFFAAFGELHAAELIVRLKSKARFNSVINSKIAGVQLTAVEQLNAIGISENDLQKVRLNADDILYVETNDEVKVVPFYRDGGPEPGSVQSLQSTPWGVSFVRAPQVWDKARGETVIVAVSDTGIWTHSDLMDNFWHNPGENGVDAEGRDKAKNGVDDDNNGYVDDYLGWNFFRNSNLARDDHYHGTHVAGTVGAVNNTIGVIGVAPNVKLMPLKFLSSSGSGSELNGARSILYAVDNGAKIVNCSWGGEGESQIVTDAIAYAQQKGVLIVAAAGNSHLNTDERTHIPSSIDLDNIISVGATTNKGRPAYFSNYGALTVDLAAPGLNIKSTFNPRAKVPQQYKKLYNFLSGTSMAAPHVSGAAALIWAKYPRLNWRQVKQILISSVTPSAKWEGKSVSGGNLNVEQAMENAQRLAGD